MKMRVVVALILFFSVMPLHGIKIGSDTAVSSENFVIFPADDTDNEIKGFAWMDKGFSLPDATTTCTFASFFPARGPIQLNCGTLWLERDFLMNNVTTFTCMGNVRATAQQSLALASGASILGCLEPNLHTFENVNLVINSNVKVHSYIQFFGDNIISGGGHLVDLDDTGSFIIAPNSSLTLADMTISNFCDGNVICSDNSSQLILVDVNWKQKDVYRFEQGSILFKGNVSILGTSTFIYDSPYTSTIDSYAQLRIGDEVWIELGKNKDNLQEPLYFTDNTSELFLDGCHLVITDSGIQFTKGQIIIADDVSIDLVGTVTQTGLILGDGTAENDVDLILLSGATITHNSGYLVYNNASPSRFKSLSSSSKFLRNENSKLAVHQSLTANNLINEAVSATVAPAEITPGKVITYINSTVRLPTLDVEVNAQQANAFSYLLSGNNSLFLTKGEFPLYLVVSGINNTLRGNGSIAGVVTLSDSASQLTWDMSGSIANSVVLNNGTLTLAHDMDIISNGIITGPGTVNLGASHLQYKKMFSGTTTPLYWQGSMNSHIVLCCNNSLSSTWTMQGRVTINGEGNEFVLGSDAALVVEQGSQLILKDIVLKGVKDNNIRCLDDDGSIRFINTKVSLEDDYTFTTGSMSFLLDNSFSGTHIFTYDSSQTATIGSISKLKFRDGATFSIDRDDIASPVEPLEFENNTSVLHFDDSTLSVGNQGMQVTKGTIRISRDSTIEINSTSTVNGLMLGDGQASGNAFIEIDPASILDLSKGHLIYNITDSAGFISKAKTSRIKQGDAYSTHFMKDIRFSDATIELSLASFTTDPGISVNISNVILDTPVGDYRLTGSRPSAFTIALTGNGDSLFVDSGVAPFPILVSNTNNTIGGEGDITAAIVLQDSDTELTSQLTGRLTSNMVMNGGSLTLINDLHLGNGVMFVGNGSVNLNSAGLHLGSQSLMWGGNTYWVGSGGAIHFNSDVSLVSTWTFSGTCMLHGNGHTVDLGDTGEIWIDSNSSVMLHELRVENAGRMRCVDDTGVITLDEAIWCQHDSDSLFSNGALRFKNKVRMHGNGVFVYSTSQTSTIHSSSKLIMEEGMTFSYDPPVAVKDLLEFEDSSSQLILKAASLHSTATGMQMKKGTLNIQGQSELSSDSIIVQTPIPHILNEGIMFGSGVAADNFTCVLVGGVNLSLTQGTLVYKNTDPDLIILESGASLLKIGVQAQLTLDESLRLVSGGIEFGNHATLMIKNGRALTSSIFPLGYLHRRSKP